ncbi:MAG: family hydrolase [Glaciihabitans sp.]|nr:family hydrolase [Glaciihabitans sp.]
MSERWLIALDIDGTVMSEDGTITDDVLDQIERMVEIGHEVMIATGRSVAMTLPVVNRLGITPDYIVCSNGAITLKRDPNAPVGYTPDVVETFQPREVLTTIRASLGDANYAVEDEDGLSRYTGAFPEGALGAGSQKVEWDDLLTHRATRVVVISPEHAIEDFLDVVEQMGLHKVSYNVGWTAWLDIAPDGVNKSTALERVRSILDIPRERVLAMGDGRNDIEMLTWAAEFGRGIAMGQAPDVVKDVANEVTATDLDDGVARIFEAISPEVK